MILLLFERTLDWTGRLTSASCAGEAYTSMSDLGAVLGVVRSMRPACMWCGPVPALALLLLLPKLL